jgi:hypothetical protein
MTTGKFRIEKGAKFALKVGDVTVGDQTYRALHLAEVTIKQGDVEVVGRKFKVTNGEITLTNAGTDIAAGNSAEFMVEDGEFSVEAGEFLDKQYSVKDGQYTVKDGQYTVKDGQYTVKYGQYTVKDGQYTVRDGQYTVKDGQITVSGQYSVKDGQYTVKDGQYTVKDGQYTVKDGQYTVKGAGPIGPTKIASMKNPAFGWNDCDLIEREK